MEDEGKEEKFDFTAECEALGYISLDRGRLLAMRTDRETPGDALNTISFRPEGGIAGRTRVKKGLK